MPKRIQRVTSQLDIPPTIMKILGGTYRSTFFGSEVLTHEEDDGLAIMIYNKKRYGVISGPNLTVFTETGEELVYERNAQPGSWKTAPSTSGQSDYSRNAIALLHLAEHLLKTGLYTTARQAKQSSSNEGRV
jgi:phosphoglycerol transferase MdoB-like AlkP superfamily enzyme